MSAFEVGPPALTAAAARCDDIAAALAHVLSSVRAQGHPDTGRSDTAAQLAEVTDRLARALRSLGTTAVADADALRAAAGTYVRTESSVVRTR
ncbi:MAG: hypothetical protein LC789_02795 [Actinobacteria bacterium]|nr:hypothetical protein [Actinomycetota bacterium]MCA1721202.1 hypothetical protein [Actinomycetota bacterium]